MYSMTTGRLEKLCRCPTIGDQWHLTVDADNRIWLTGELGLHAWNRLGNISIRVEVVFIHVYTGLDSSYDMFKTSLRQTSLRTEADSSGDTFISSTSEDDGMIKW